MEKEHENNAYYEAVKANPTRSNKLQFLLHHRGYLSNIVDAQLSMTHPQDRDDIVADIFLGLVKHVDKMDYSRSYKEIKGYLSRSVVNYSIHRWKKINSKKRVHSEHEFGIDRSIEEIPVPTKDNRAKDIIYELKRLATKKELQIINGYLDGLSPPEIAEKIGFTRQYLDCLLSRFGKRIYRKYKKDIQ